MTAPFWQCSNISSTWCCRNNLRSGNKYRATRGTSRQGWWCASSPWRVAARLTGRLRLATPPNASHRRQDPVGLPAPGTRTPAWHEYLAPLDRQERYDGLMHLQTRPQHVIHDPAPRGYPVPKCPPADLPPGSQPLRCPNGFRGSRYTSSPPAPA